MKDEEASLDILREISTMGAGNAATAISELIGKRINIDVPHTRYLGLKEASTSLGRSEVTIAISIEFDGEMPGHFFILMDRKDALKLLRLMLNRDVEEVGDFETSAILEMGNILTGAFLSSVANFLDITLRQFPPKIKVEMIRAILDEALAECGKRGDKIWMANIKFSIEETRSSGYLLFIPFFSLVDELQKRLKDLEE